MLVSLTLRVALRFSEVFNGIGFNFGRTLKAFMNFFMFFLVSTFFFLEAVPLPTKIEFL